MGFSSLTYKFSKKDANGNKTIPIQYGLFLDKLICKICEGQINSKVIIPCKC